MDWTPPDEPTDEESLRQALETVVGTAHRNGVVVERDWPCRGPGDHDWGVDIVRLATVDDGGAGAQEGGGE
ncbi:hypothetical protein [Haloplanus halophilus]|uniref:hypothetical protein n=1 Tax=Haloplanus halophilus TaxID=2949993 RepID=UPI00203B9D43|nr:hypothetical protein [Haloplanus sp. GDY1]